MLSRALPDGLFLVTEDRHPVRSGSSNPSLSRVLSYAQLTPSVARLIARIVMLVEFALFYAADPVAGNLSSHSLDQVLRPAPVQPCPELARPRRHSTVQREASLLFPRVVSLIGQAIIRRLTRNVMARPLRGGLSGTAWPVMPAPPPAYVPSPVMGDLPSGFADGTVCWYDVDLSPGAHPPLHVRRWFAAEVCTRSRSALLLGCHAKSRYARSSSWRVGRWCRGRFPG